MESADRTVTPVNQPSGLTVLHVEDDPGFAELTRITLERARDSLHVVTKDDPTAALEWLEAGTETDAPPVDCIVSDYQMPGMNGVELLRAVRDRWHSVPFILYTGQGSEEVAADAFAADATDYLHKDAGSAAAEVLANRIESAVAVESQRSDYRELFEAAGDGILVHETRGDRILDVNPAFCELIGYEREELLGMGIGDFSAVDAAFDADAAAARIERAATEGPQVFEWVVERADGHHLPVEVSLARAELGGVSRVLAHVRDISERREQERRFEAIFDGTFQFIGLLEPDGTLLEANDTALEFGGFEEPDVVGRPFWEAPWWTGDEERVATLRDAVERAAEGAFVRYDVEVEGADGSVVIDFSLQPVHDEDGEVELLIPEGRDVTEHREREDEPKRQNRQLKAAYERLDEGYYAVDGDWTVTYWNDRMVDRTGVSAAEAVGASLWDAVPSFVGTEFEIYYREAMAAQRSVSFEGYEEAFGQWVEVRVYPSAEGLSVYSRDVSERKAREDELARMRELLDMAQEFAGVGGWEYDLRSGEALLTGQARVLFGVGQDWEPTLEGAMAQFHPDDRDRLRRAFTDAIEAGVPFDLELRLDEETRSGEPRWVRQICQPISMGAETVLLRGTTQDVTARHRFERRLREREREIREERAFTDSLLDALPDPFYLLDADGWLARWNETFGERTGYADEALAGMHVLEFVPDEDADRVEAWLASVGEGETATVESALVTDDGERLPHEFNASPVYDGHGRDFGLAGAARDISARVEREAELQRQNERLESFTSIVSHDLRNPMAVMRGALDTAGPDDDPEALARAERALDRMSTLVADLLTLAQQGEDVGETMGVDLESVVGRSWSLADTGEATLEVEGTFAFLADPSRLTQVLENLFRNAADHASTETSATVRVGPLPDDDGFYVADDGPGIPADRRDLVFRHGFTDSRDGTGFGLAIVRSIVEAHGWTVAATDSKDGGARFEVRGVRPVGRAG